MSSDAIYCMQSDIQVPTLPRLPSHAMFVTLYKTGAAKAVESMLMSESAQDMVHAHSVLVPTGYQSQTGHRLLKLGLTCEIGVSSQELEVLTNSTHTHASVVKSKIS